MRGVPDIHSDFRGGVNLAAAPYALAQNQARDLRNVNSDVVGALRKRNGFGELVDLTLPPTSIFPYHGTTDYIIAIGDDGATTTDIYRITQAGSDTSIKGGATVSVGEKWEAIQAPASGGQGPLWMINGTDTPLQWTGTGNVASWTKSGSDDIPNGKYIVYFDNRVWIAGVSSDPSKLYWSALGDPRLWDTPNGGSTTFDPDDGEAITGLGKVGPYLLVFKPTKTYVVFNSDTGGYRRISNEMGCVAHRSIVETEIGTFFLAAEGIVMITDGSGVEPVSQNALEPMFDNIPAANLVYAAGIHSNRQYYLSIDWNDTGINDIVLEYDFRFDSWWIHEIQLDASTTTGVLDWCIINPESSAMLYAACGSGHVDEAFKKNVYQDHDLSYESYWITEWHVFGNPHIRKIMRQVRADCLGECSLSMAQSFSIEYDALDTVYWEPIDAGSETFGGGGNFGGTGYFGGQEPIIEHRYYTPGTARAFSFKFFNSGSQRWELYAYSLMYDMRTD